MLQKFIYFRIVYQLIDIYIMAYTVAVSQLGFFASQYCHYCRLCGFVDMSLLEPYHVSKYEIEYQLVHEEYISRLQTLLAQLISSSTT